MSDTLTRVLYVDDEPHIRTLAQLSLERVGGLVTCICDSGRSAVAAAPAFAPDLILLDVMMPDMDGPQTLTALRKVPSLVSTPVIFVTAKVQPQEMQRYSALGAVATISKPFAPLELPKRLQEIWSRLPSRGVVETAQLLAAS
jgi:two-component system OmpR family response regulator